jgi:hypothetical protein
MDYYEIYYTNGKYEVYRITAWHNAIFEKYIISEKVLKNFMRKHHARLFR